ncbi:MAG: heme exporter protein CcmB [Flavobacteriales bacterium]|nr:heme exporter protein CcmB [Flavobacteriales bacterium]
MVSRILYLIKYEALLEFRNKALTGSLFVYVISTVFVCYRSFRSVENAETWNALFWIVVLFSSTNAVLRSFQRENKNQALYLYQTLKPGEVILSKIAFNYILTLALIGGTLPVFALLLGNPVRDIWTFVLIAFLAAGAFSATLTLVSAMAGKTGNAAGLTPVLGFPVILPVLMVAIKAAGKAAAGEAFTAYWDLAVVLAAFNAVIVILSFLLFPYLWRD